MKPRRLHSDTILSMVDDVGPASRGQSRFAPILRAPHADLRVPLRERPPVRGHAEDHGRPGDRLRGRAAAPVQRVFHPVAVHFKGSGFYNTDYGTAKRKREGQVGQGGRRQAQDAKQAREEVRRRSRTSSSLLVAELGPSGYAD